MEKNENETIAEQLKKSIVDEVTGTIKDTVKSLLDEKETAQKQEIENLKTAHKKDLEDALKNVNPFGGIIVGENRNEQPIDGFKSYRDAEIFGTWLKGLSSYDSRNEAINKLNNLGVKTHYAGNNATGGYFVPVEVSYAIINQLQQYGTYNRYGRVITMGTDTMTMPNLLQGLTGYWIGEGIAPTESQFSLGSITLNIKKIGALVELTEDLINDSVVNIAQLATPLFVQAIAEKLDDAVINGDGTSTYGGITGLRSSLTNISGTISSIKGLKVATGNAYSEITTDDFRATASLLATRFRTGAQWVVSPAFFDTVIAPKIQSSSFVGTDLTQAAPVRWLGYNVILEEKMPTTEANSQVCALLGNFQNAALIGNRQQIAINSTDSNGTNFAEGIVTYRATAKLGYTVYGQGDTTKAGSYVGLITAAS